MTDTEQIPALKGGQDRSDDEIYGNAVLFTIFIACLLILLAVAYVVVDLLPERSA